ncbi:MAG TPA: SAM-dependent methyltransferase [Xanthobacteraceae bacterium]|nr:SAM-dependent methyltransferase [Xanthobacteraceae bacterium]
MAPGKPPLEAEIRRLISVAGSIPLSQYMALCLSHPEHGYYITHDPFGASGDFVTAPEISQMFGELLGVWAVATWKLLGSPERLQLIELGPGRGTMINDALRAARVMPDFRRAIDVHLIEASPLLRRRQRHTLGVTDIPVAWHDALTEVPEAPAIILANEFLDAMPVNQAVKQKDGWYERVIKLDEIDNLVFGLAPEPIPHFERTLPPHVREAPVGSIFEWRSNTLVLEIGRRMARAGGAALLIDFGHVKSDIGETLQAVRTHVFTDPLAAPGMTDLTAHVDFEAVAITAESIGARVHGPIEQATFLRRLGIEARAGALRSVAPDRASEIDSAVGRLTEGGRTGMGTMFKVIALSSPALAMLPGFDA